MSANVVGPDAERDSDEGSISVVSLSLILGDPAEFALTAVLAQDTILKCDLRIEPDKPAVIGRCDTRDVPYLEAGFRPTTLVPGTGQTILVSGGSGRDNYVSRAHFMLRAAAGGVLLVNGVPKRGGGIRPPKNGTRLLAPVDRALSPAEEYLIERNVETLITLPNGSVVKIEAR
jgi:hypothetical protein